jgi:hypothetical protein
MPVSGLTVGRDLSLQINTGTTTLNLTSNDITSFDSQPMAKMDDYTPISGIIDPLLFPLGWKINMEVARTGPSVDEWWAQLEALYFNGGNIPSGTIYETITEKDGTTTQWIYTNVQLKLEDAGMFKGNDYVTQKLTGQAARKQQLS